MCCCSAATVSASNVQSAKAQQNGSVSNGHAVAGSSHAGSVGWHRYRRPNAATAASTRARGSWFPSAGLHALNTNSSEPISVASASSSVAWTAFSLECCPADVQAAGGDCFPRNRFRPGTLCLMFRVSASVAAAAGTGLCGVTAAVLSCSVDAGVVSVSRHLFLDASVLEMVVGCCCPRTCPGPCERTVQYARHCSANLYAACIPESACTRPACSTVCSFVVNAS